MKIAIIGTGNIGGAVAKGLLKDHFAAQNLIFVLISILLGGESKKILLQFMLLMTMNLKPTQMLLISQMNMQEQNT